MIATTDSSPSSYRTRGGIRVQRTAERIDGAQALEALLEALDTQRGAVFASSYEYPGRYTRWDMGFRAPPLVFEATGRTFRLRALNERGAVLLGPLEERLRSLDAVHELSLDRLVLEGCVRTSTKRFTEEDRSRQPSVFSVLRAVIDLFASDADPHLGLYGAFGYDLAFQFEPVNLRLKRTELQRDLVLYLPDEILIVDHRRQDAFQLRYEFDAGGKATRDLPRTAEEQPFVGASRVDAPGDHESGEYANKVRAAREFFRRGDLFEAVPSQVFFEPCPAPPSELFRRLRERNPAPYGFLLNLGEDEYLVGASPEMYVRVEGRRVETCPIAGTISRGKDALGDAAQIRALLNSEKDESELTMCTDVDRNDKSRICEPGSVRILGRRQIEIYSRLIHTVDHVEGRLRPEFDALDAFLAHTWAVTVTGAPKTWAMQFIEDHEKSPRAWYGGAVGIVGFDGNLNSGLTLRTIRVKDGVAEIRVGATLLFDSDPEAEERETRLKASAFIDALRRPLGVARESTSALQQSGTGKRVLLIDHQDSFVHTLANYLRQTGAVVTTLRSGFPLEALDELQPHLVVLSPGPGRPADFDVSATVAALLDRSLPVFGVCLGLQGIVEHFGGELALLPTPCHGKPSTVHARGGRIFEGLPKAFQAGRYHSLFARRDRMPPELEVTAETGDGVVMAVEHTGRPVAAVQFHPESILTLDGEYGLRLLSNVVSALSG